MPAGRITSRASLSYIIFKALTAYEIGKGNTAQKNSGLYINIKIITAKLTMEITQSNKVPRRGSSCMTFRFFV